MARLRAVLRGLSDAELGMSSGSGWSVAATLAHLAFYDDWVAERWRRWLEVEAFQDLPDDITELVNASVSSTVKDLVAGSGLVFEDRGEHELKGVPDRWRLYRVVSR